MKSADNRPAWSSFETGYHRARRALAVVQRAGVVCLLALAPVIVASRTAYGQDLPDSGSPGSAIWTGDSMIIWGGYKRNPGKPPDLLNTGWSLNPVGGGVWTRLTNMAPLSARTHQVAVWTGKEMIVWGGGNGSSRPTGFASGMGRSARAAAAGGGLFGEGGDARAGGGGGCEAR